MESRKTMPGEILIRRARMEDIDRIVAFNAAMARETEDRELDPAILRRGVEAVIRDPSKGWYLLAEREGKAAGQLLVTFEWSDWRNGLFYWIQSVYVTPGERRRGIFRLLYEHVRREAVHGSGCGLRLYVHEHNDIAQETYRRQAMVKTPYVVYEDASLAGK